jgi:hypothetical protein
MSLELNFSRRCTASMLYAAAYMPGGIEHPRGPDSTNNDDERTSGQHAEGLR